jgi:hypothetical protein
MLIAHLIEVSSWRPPSAVVGDRNIHAVYMGEHQAQWRSSSGMAGDRNEFTKAYGVIAGAQLGGCP